MNCKKKHPKRVQNESVACILFKLLTHMFSFIPNFTMYRTYSSKAPALAALKSV